MNVYVLINLYCRAKKIVNPLERIQDIAEQVRLLNIAKMSLNYYDIGMDGFIHWHPINVSDNKIYYSKCAIIFIVPYSKWYSTFYENHKKETSNIIKNEFHI